MHVGRVYPYLRDRWAIPTAFWPGFAPAAIKLEHSALPNEWLILQIFKEITFEGVAAADRQSVSYTFEELLGPTDFYAQITFYNAAIDPNARLPAYKIRCWNLLVPTAFDLRAYAFWTETYTRGWPAAWYWTEAVDFTTGAPIPPPGSIPVPASWAEFLPPLPP